MAGGSFISRAGRYNRFLISWFLFKKQWILQMNTSEGMRLRRPFTSLKNSSMSRLMHWFDIALPISKTLFRCEKIFAASRRTKCAARTSAVFVTNKNRFLTFVSTDHDARLLDETKKFLQNDSFMNCHKCESAERAIQWVTPVEADKSANAWRRNHRFPVASSDFVSPVHHSSQKIIPPFDHGQWFLSDFLLMAKGITELIYQDFNSEKFILSKLKVIDEMTKFNVQALCFVQRDSCSVLLGYTPT